MEQNLLLVGDQLLRAAHVGTQHLGHGDGAVGVLVVLDDGGHGAAHGKTAAVERVREVLPAVLVDVLDVGATRLEVTAVAAARYLLVGTVAG